MKKLNLFIFVGVIAIFSACQKQNDNITVTLKTAGSLNVQIIDSTGKAYPKVKVHLFLSYSSSSELDNKTTDNNGNVNFGTLESGSYYLATDTIKKGNKKYLISKAIQIISGDSKSVVLNPMEYVGTIKLQVYINTSGIDSIKRTTLRVALVSYNDRITSDNRQKVLSKAADVKSCDASGKVEFDNIPANIEYYAYVYINNSDSVGGWSSSEYMVSKDDTYSGNATVYATDLIVIRTIVNLTIEYYSYTTFNYKPVQAVNVILVYYDDYYNNSLQYASQNTIKSYKVVSGITNSSGVIAFTGVPANKEYFIYIYFNGSYYMWYSSYFEPYSGSSYNQTIEVIGSNLGLTK
jgi:hypothetical protein